MNDAVAIYGAVAVVFAVGLLAFFGYSVYSGVKDNLSNAKIGQIYNFEYKQPLHGEPERFMAKILDIYTLSDDAIRRLNRRSSYRRNDDNFVRTNHLVTAQTFDGKIRNFYAERAVNVRRSLFGGLLLKTGVASLLF